MVVVFGLLIGFFSSMPLGPVNLVAISQVIQRGFRHGFLIGITTGLMDASYCFAALLGIAQITQYLSQLEIYIKMTAVLLFVFLGIRALHSAKKPQTVQLPDSFRSIHRPVLAAMALCLTNPALYAYWIGVAGFVTTQGWMTGNIWKTGVFSVAVLVGTIGWYTLLSRYVAKYHHQFSPRAFRTIFTTIAVGLFGFAGYTLYTVVQKYIG